jgi:hypothetical protein
LLHKPVVIHTLGSFDLVKEPRIRSFGRVEVDQDELTEALPLGEMDDGSSSRAINMVRLAARVETYPTHLALAAVPGPSECIAILCHLLDS